MGACIKLQQVAAAAAFLICFDALLRPGELYKLKKKHITWAGGKAVLSLGQTKTGQRKNASEMVVFRSKTANFWLYVYIYIYTYLYISISIIGYICIYTHIYIYIYIDIWIYL